MSGEVAAGTPDPLHLNGVRTTRGHGHRPGIATGGGLGGSSDPRDGAGLLVALALLALLPTGRAGQAAAPAEPPSPIERVSGTACHARQSAAGTSSETASPKDG